MAVTRRRACLAKDSGQHDFTPDGRPVTMRAPRGGTSASTRGLMTDERMDLLLYNRPRYSLPALIGGSVLFMTFLTLLVTFTDSDARTAEELAAMNRPANTAAIIARTPEAIFEAQQALIEAAKSAASAGAAGGMVGNVTIVAQEAPGSAAPATEPPPPFSEFTGTMARNMTLSGILSRHGVDGGEVNALVVALKPHFSFRRARPGSKYSLTVRNSDSRIESFEWVHGPLDVFEAWRDDDVLKGRKAEINVRTEVAAVGAKIDSTLFGAVQHTGESTQLAATLMDVFAYDLDFMKDTRPGDVFKLLVEKVFKDAQFIKYGKVIAAEYKSVKKGAFRAYWFDPGDELPGSYYLEDGRNTRKTFLATPVRAARISSGFGMRRHPVLGYNRRHAGVDFAAPTGTPVMAMADAKVVFAGVKGANGKLIVLKHARGLTSLYAHLSRIKVKRGQTVKQKQVIGAVGTTGRSTGPHLHFGVKKHGRYVNPQKMKMTRDVGIPKAAKARFDALIVERKGQLDAVHLGGRAVVALSPTRVVEPLPKPRVRVSPPPAPVSDGIPMAEVPSPVSAAPVSAAPVSGEPGGQP